MAALSPHTRSRLQNWRDVVTYVCPAADNVLNSRSPHKALWGWHLQRTASPFETVSSDDSATSSDRQA